MSAFSPPLISTFTGSNGSLNGVTVDGYVWTAPAELSGDTALNISSNAAKSASGSANGGIDSLTFGPNLRVSMKVATPPGTGNAVAFNCRVPQAFPYTPGVGSTYYSLPFSVVTGASNDTVSAYRVVNNSATKLTSPQGDITGFDLAAGDIIGYELVETGSGTLITALLNGVALGSWFDTDGTRQTAAGRLFIAASDATAVMDDLRAETIPTLPIGTAPARFYLEDTTDTPAVSPGFTTGYSWGKTSIGERRILVPKSQKIGTTITARTYALLGTNPSDTLARQWISSPLAAQLIRGHVKGVVRVLESGTTVNAAAQCIVYVVSGDGTTLRKLLVPAQTRGATTSPPEWSTAGTGANKFFPQSWASPGKILVPYACADGDRLVVELGVGQQSTSTAAQTFRWGASAASDLAEDESSTTDNNPWFEFLLGVEFKSLAVEPRRVRRNVLLRR